MQALREAPPGPLPPFLRKDGLQEGCLATASGLHFAGGKDCLHFCHLKQCGIVTLWNLKINV